MDDLSKISAAPLDLRSTLGPLGRPSHGLSPPSPLPPKLPQVSSTRSSGWETISEQRGFYDEQDSLRPGYNLAIPKLQNRGRDEVVIFDCSLVLGILSGVDGNPTVEGGGAPSERFSTDDDVFLWIPKKLTKSREFDDIINPTKEPRLIPPRGARLRIM